MGHHNPPKFPICIASELEVPTLCSTALRRRQALHMPPSQQLDPLLSNHFPVLLDIPERLVVLQSRLKHIFLRGQIDAPTGQLGAIMHARIVVQQAIEKRQHTLFQLLGRANQLQRAAHLNQKPAHKRVEIEARSQRLVRVLDKVSRDAAECHGIQDLVFKHAVDVIENGNDFLRREADEVVHDFGLLPDLVDALLVVEVVVQVEVLGEGCQLGKACGEPARRVWAPDDVVAGLVEGVGEAVAAVEVVARVAGEVVQGDGGGIAGCAFVACDAHELGRINARTGHLYGRRLVRLVVQLSGDVRVMV